HLHSDTPAFGSVLRLQFRGVCGGSETLPSFPCVGGSPLRPTTRPGMPEAERREVDAMLRGLGPKYQRQLSVSTSNALESFAILEAVVQYRKLVLLLDYDGTLTPIVKDP
ncbi:unnamed protein product, partial [Ectocarpus sp. 4 AP-2014]